jgi:hypothetical protein
VYCVASEPRKKIWARQPTSRLSRGPAAQSGTATFATASARGGLRIAKHAAAIAERYAPRQAVPAPPSTIALAAHPARPRHPRRIASRAYLGTVFERPLARAEQIRSQRQRQRGWKLYSSLAPEVECIAPYEFGVKASIVTQRPVRASRQGDAGKPQRRTYAQRRRRRHREAHRPRDRVMSTRANVAMGVAASPSWRRDWRRAHRTAAAVRVAIPRRP